MDVLPDATNQAHVALGTGHLLVAMDTVDTRLDLGDAKRQRFTITNDGTAPVEVELAEG